ncbi:MAG: F0F1 ATP synthase subunit epsilon [Candidatus Paceibacterota bacterium]
MQTSPSFILTLTTPKGILLTKEVTRVTLPSHEGEITILAHHEPLIALARKGIVVIETTTGEEEKVSIDAGIIEVHNDGTLVLLLEDATLE